MKQPIVAIATLCLITTSASKISAQENNYAIPAAHRTTSINSPSAVPAGVRTKVFNHFNDNFKSATDVSWSTSGGNTSVYYKENGVMSRSTYNDRGVLQFTLRYFYGNQVPEQYTRMVRRAGYFQPVTMVTEVSRRNVKTQFVKLESETSLTTVQIHPDGDVTVYEDFAKAKK